MSRFYLSTFRIGSKHPQYGPIFLTGEAVIGRGGAVEGIEVVLPHRLRAYALPEPPPTVLLVNAIRASLDLLKLAPDMVSYVVFATMFRPILGRIDTAVMLVGETGRFKTAFAAILFTHYGAGFSRKHLPDGWSSSAASLEQTAYLLADVVIFFDDFKLPQTREKRLEELDKLRRLLAGAADGVGRGTLTQNREMRQNVYPRGLIFLTAEEAPQGESTVARSIIVPVSEPLHGPDNIRRPEYNKAEASAHDGVYAETMAGYIQYVAQHFDKVTVGSEQHRQHIIQHVDHFAGRHPRTGAALAELSYGMRVFLNFAVDTGAITAEQAEDYWQNCISAFQEVAALQGGYVEQENPVQRFESQVNTLFAQGRIHLVERKTGAVPQDSPEMVGWFQNTGFGRDDDSNPQSHITRPGSQMVGWTERQGNQQWAYFLPRALYEQLQVTSFRQQQTFPSETALWSALRDAYLKRGLMRCEGYKNPKTGKTGFRKRYRIEAHGRQGQIDVLALSLPLGQPLSSGNNGISGREKENNSAETAIREIPPSMAQGASPEETGIVEKSATRKQHDGAISTESSPLSSESSHFGALISPEKTAEPVQKTAKNPQERPLEDYTTAEFLKEIFG